MNAKASNNPDYDKIENFLQLDITSRMCAGKREYVTKAKLSNKKDICLILSEISMRST